MIMRNQRYAVIAAGALTGLAGLVAFELAHAIIIAPICRSIVGGLPFALATGVAMAIAFDALYRSGRYSAGWWDGARFGSIIWLSLVPVSLVRAFGRPMISGNSEVAIEVILAILAGAAAGWLLSRTRRGTMTFAIATLLLAAEMGGPGVWPFS